MSKIEKGTPNPQEYELSTLRLLGAGMVGPGLESIQNVPNVHEFTPEPFDITNHAGNMWGGTFIGTAAALAYSIYIAKKYGEDDLILPANSVSRFRRVGVPVVGLATALINTVTETKWGLSTFPIGKALNGPVPDILDTLYSTAWGIAVSCAVWRRIPSRNQAPQTAQYNSKKVPQLTGVKI